MEVARGLHGRAWGPRDRSQLRVVRQEFWTAGAMLAARAGGSAVCAAVPCRGQA